jgi:hypothetical protein
MTATTISIASGMRKTGFERGAELSMGRAGHTCLLVISLAMVLVQVARAGADEGSSGQRPDSLAVGKRGSGRAEGGIFLPDLPAELRDQVLKLQREVTSGTALDGKTREKVNALIADLGAGETEFERVRGRNVAATSMAMWRLRTVGRGALGQLIAATTHKDPRIRGFAVRAVYQITRAAREQTKFLPVFARSLWDGSPNVRASAMGVIGSIGPSLARSGLRDQLERVIRYLKWALGDGDRSVVSGAGAALWRMGRRDLVPKAMILIEGWGDAWPWGDVWDPPEGFAETADRIRELARSRDLSAEDKIRGLGKLGKGMETRWRDADAGAYGRLTLKLCEGLRSARVRSSKGRPLASGLAVRALGKADKMPLKLEWGLLAHMKDRVDEGGNKLDGNAWARVRLSRAELWLRAWRRVEQTRDPKWDPANPPPLCVAPPRQTGLRAGVPPTAVKDPKLRAEYERAIKANRERAEWFNEQSHAFLAWKMWLPAVEKFIIDACSKPAPKAAELADLERLLQKYLSDRNARLRILNAVSDR